MMSLALLLSLRAGTINAAQPKKGPYEVDAHTVALWRLDGSLEDASSSGNNLRSDSGEYSEGRYSLGLQVKANGDYVAYVPDNPSLSITGDLTVEAWIKPDAESFGRWSGIVTKWIDGREASYGLFMGKSHLRFMISGDGRTLASVHSEPPLEAGRWYHVAGIYYTKPAGPVMELYVNGRKANSRTEGVPASIYDGKAAVEIGSYNSRHEVFKGVIDEVRISNINRVRDATAISMLSDIPVIKDRQHQRSRIILDKPWKLSRLKMTRREIPISKGRGPGYWEKEFDDSKWDMVEVPSNWYKDRTWCREQMKEGNFYAAGWYRKKVVAPKEYEGKRAILRFERVDYKARVWVNGHEVGEHKGAYTPFEFDIAEAVEFGKENTLAVKVVDDIFDVSKAPYKAVYGASWVGPDGGIMGSVQLIFKPPVYVKRTCINPNLAEQSLHIDYWLINTFRQTKRYEITGIVEPDSDDDKPVVEQTFGEIVLKPGLTRGNLSLKIDNPRYWWPEDPYLYRFVLLLKEGDKIVERHRTTFGFRDFKVRGKNFYLNGKKVRLRGTSFAPWATWGSLTPEQIKTFFLKYKAMGINMVRLHTMPAHPRFYDVADKSGMMVYNEWAWYHTERVEEDVFVPQNIKELEEWFYRDYNHPSVVMWKLANELWMDRFAPLHNRIYAHMRPIDRSGRPIVSAVVISGGVRNIAKPIKTDVWDVHSYIGAGQQEPWTFLDEYIRFAHSKLSRICGGEKPLMSWENVYYVYSLKGQPQIPVEEPLSVEKYLELAASEAPAGHAPAWHIKTVGLRDFMTRGKGASEYGRRYYKRIVEIFRRSELVSGVAPFGAGWLPPIYRVPPVESPLNPTYICADRFGKNLFAGANLKTRIFVLNDSYRAKDGLSAKIAVNDSNGIVLEEFRREVGELKEGSRQVFDYTWQIPSELATGTYELRLFLYQKDNLLSRNSYEFFVLGKNRMVTRIETERKIAVYHPGIPVGTRTGVEKILDKLQISYDRIGGVDRLADYEILILPEYKGKIKKWPDITPRIPVIGKKIRTWIENGGRLLSFEQSLTGTIPWAEEFETYTGRTANTFIDLAVPNHPAFKGLPQARWDTWNGDKGVIAEYCIAPLSENVVGAMAEWGSWKPQIGMAIAEVKIGKGYCLLSQVEAAKRYNIDSAAHIYIHNLLSYLLTQEERPGIRLLKKETAIVLNPESCFYVDLRPYANMGFKDEVKDDRKGGWTDQGENDLRNIPLGRQTMRGVPFEIIDPRQNNNRSAIVLKGGPKTYFPEEVKGIKVGQDANRLYFLQTSAWSEKGLIAKYVIHYEDGSKIEIPLEGGINIEDWWKPRDLKTAKLAWQGRNPISPSVGLYLMRWDDPFPQKKIEIIDFVSTGLSIPILVAITGYKSPQQIFADDFSRSADKWNTIGEVTIEKEELSLDAVNKVTSLAKIKDLNIADYIIQYKVKFIGSLKDGQAGVRFRLSEGKYVEVFLRLHKLSYFWTGIQVEGCLALRPYLLNKWYSLRLECQGRQIRVYFDNIHIRTVDKVPVARKGGICFYTWKAHAHFDDVRIFSLRK